MKCPFNTTTTIVDLPSPPIYHPPIDGNDLDDRGTYQYLVKQVQTEVMQDCIEDECAMWQDGKCQRR